MISGVRELHPAMARQHAGELVERPSEGPIIACDDGAQGAPALVTPVGRGVARDACKVVHGAGGKVRYQVEASATIEPPRAGIPAQWTGDVVERDGGGWSDHGGRIDGAVWVLGWQDLPPDICGGYRFASEGTERSGVSARTERRVSHAAQNDGFWDEPAPISGVGSGEDRHRRGDRSGS